MTDFPEHQNMKGGSFRTVNHAIGNANGRGDISVRGDERTIPPAIGTGDRLVGGRYEVLSVQAGGMDMVYKCNDTMTDTVVGLKTVQTDGEMSELQIRQMRRNYELVHGLSHEHIIRVNILEIDKVRNQWFLVMDWVEGEDLDSRLRHTDGNRLPADETIRLLRQVARALDYAHGKGVIHRDVKCANIMVKKEDGNALLIDFGIAKKTVRSVQQQEGALSTTAQFSEVSRLVGTPNYQSPEQWRGEKKLTAASDNYSFGVVAYRCLSGHLPFASVNDGQLQEMVLHDPVPVIRTLPPEAGMVLAKAMAKDPNQRYTSCVNFLDELSKGLESTFTWKEFRNFTAKIDKSFSDLDVLKWDRGQTFGMHLDEFVKACQNAQDVMDDYPCDEYLAYELYKKADEEWRWLERNAPLRETASPRLSSLQTARRDAEERQAERYAKNFYQDALRKQENALAYYEAGEFELAMTDASLAIKLFQNAEQVAGANHIHELVETVHSLIEQKNFGECDAKIDELKGLDGQKASKLHDEVCLAKDACIRQAEESIQEAIGQNRIQEAEGILPELALLSAEKGGYWEEIIKGEKEKHIQKLKDDILERKARNDFDGIGKQVDELAIWDSNAASESMILIAQAKAEYIDQLLNDIKKLVSSNDFEGTDVLIGRLVPLDPAEAVRQSVFVKSERTRLVGEIERKISDAFASKAFGAVVASFKELSAFDKARTEILKEDYLHKTEKLVKETIEQRRFGDIEIFRPLEALEAEKLRSWITEIEQARSKHIQDLEKDCEELLTQKEFDLALKKTKEELLPLDSRKAGEWKEKVQRAKDEEIGCLERVISTAVDAMHFDDAFKKAEKLRLLDKIKAEGWLKNVQDAKNKEISRLEQLIPTALDAKCFDDALKTVEELRPLAMEKAERSLAIVQAAKDKEINRLEQLIATEVNAMRFNEALNAIENLRPLAAEKAGKWLANVQSAKAMEITRLEQEISSSLEKKRFDEVLRGVENLRPFAMDKTEEWLKKVQTLKAMEITRLEQSISMALDERHYADTEGLLQELANLEEKLAEEWRKKVENKKSLDVVTSIENAIAHGRFDAAKDLIQKLEKLDSQAAAFSRKKLETIVNEQISKIENAASDALDKQNFEEALAEIQPLASLNEELYRQWGKDIADAKEICIGRLKQEIADGIDQFDFENANEKLRLLMPLVKTEDYQRWKHAITKGVEERLNRLEEVVYEATTGLRFAEAETALSELEKLAPMKAREWADYVQSRKLEQVIHQTIADGRFAKAETALSELENLNPESAGKMKNLIQMQRTKIIEDLDAAVRDALKDKDFNKAHEKNERLKLLNSEKAVAWAKQIETLESQEKHLTVIRCKKILRYVMACTVGISLLLFIGLGGFYIHERYVLKKMTELHDELVALQPSWRKLDSVKNQISPLPKILAHTSLNSLPADLFNRLNVAKKTLNDLELSQDKHDELEKWRLRFLSAGSKAEWEEKTVAMKPSDDALKKLESVASDFKASIAARDGCLLDVISKLDVEVNTTLPEIISKLPFTDHELSLAVIRAFVDNIQYLLFWYDEKNTVGVSFDVDKKLVAIWKPEKAYSGENAAEDCRKDAMAKVRELEAMSKNSKQWQDWSKRLWEVVASLEDKRLKDDIFKRLKDDIFELDELDELDRLASGFGNYKNEFRKALAVVRNEMLQWGEEKEKIKAEVERIRTDVILHYHDYLAENFRWKEEGMFKDEKEWCEQMQQETAKRLSVFSKKHAKDVETLHKWIAEISDEAQKILLPDLQAIHEINVGCGGMLKKINDKRIALMKKNPLLTDDEIRKLKGEVDKMEGDWGKVKSHWRTVLNNTVSNNIESRNELKNIDVWGDLYITLSNNLKSSGDNSVKSKIELTGKKLDELKITVNNIVHLAQEVKKYEEYGKTLQKAKLFNKNELIVKNRDMPIQFDLIQEMAKKCGSESPLVNDMLQRARKTKNDWQKAIQEWEKNGDFENNLAKMQGVLEDLRSSNQWKNLCVQDAVEKKISENEVDDERLKYINRMEEAAGKTEAFSDQQKKQKNKILQEFEMLLLMAFPKTIVVLPGNVRLEMVKVKADTAFIGSPEDELGRSPEEPIQEEKLIQRDFWIGKIEVTQLQYKAIMGENPSDFKGDDLPVEHVTRKNAMEFCKKLTEREQKAARLPRGYEYSLPTEIQWEYACRAGTRTALNNGRNLTRKDECRYLNKIGWYFSNSSTASHKCGKKEPNHWWLRDMHGNVWEWCRKEDLTYVLRGGSWNSSAFNCRSSSSIISDIGSDNDVGFRIALVPAQ